MPERHESHSFGEGEEVVEKKFESCRAVLEVKVLEDGHEAHDHVVEQLGQRAVTVLGAAAEVGALKTATCLGVMMDSCTGWAGRWAGRWADGWMAGWPDGRMAGWPDGRMAR